jgi:hypothetical protein
MKNTYFIPYVYYNQNYNIMGFLVESDTLFYAVYHFSIFPSEENGTMDTCHFEYNEDNESKLMREIFTNKAFQHHKDSPSDGFIEWMKKLKHAPLTGYYKLRKNGSIEFDHF